MENVFCVAAVVRVAALEVPAVAQRAAKSTNIRLLSKKDELLLFLGQEIQSLPARHETQLSVSKCLSSTSAISVKSSPLCLSHFGVKEQQHGKISRYVS